MRIGAINCAEQRRTCSSFRVHGFPTVRIFGPSTRLWNAAGQTVPLPKDFIFEHLKTDVMKGLQSAGWKGFQNEGLRMMVVPDERPRHMALVSSRLGRDDGVEGKMVQMPWLPMANLAEELTLMAQRLPCQRAPLYHPSTIHIFTCFLDHRNNEIATPRASDGGKDVVYVSDIENALHYHSS